MRTRDSEKQQRIKEAMVRLILEEGMSGASVSKIAREAGVSPATIYIYYTSKEEMISEVFREYSHKSYHYLLRQIRPEMSGADLIDTIVRSSYRYFVENEEIFSFVEQCSHCPTISGSVQEAECCGGGFELMHHYQELGIVRHLSDMNLSAVLFAPVKFLAMNRGRSAHMQEELSELSAMLQRLLLN